MNVEELLSFKPAAMTPSREANTEHHPVKRKRKLAAGRDDSGILKKPQLSSSAVKQSTNYEAPIDSFSKTEGTIESGIEISEEERQRILQMVEDEPEVAPLDDSTLKRMVSVLEKKIAKNQEMRIKFPDQPEKFMESEFELHQSIQELHALAAMPSLYPLSVELSLPSTLLGLLAHENADISCSVIDLLKETTDDDILEDNEDECIAFVDSLLDRQVLSLLTQNLDRLDESNKDEAEGVHNTLSIFENLFETRSQLCNDACENGLLKWLLKRIRARLPFDANKLYAGEILAICLQVSQSNRALLGSMDGIDVLLQQLAVYKRHDPNSSEESEYMGNIFNCMCSALLYGPNKGHFLKGEGPQLMNLMLREKKQSRGGALKVLNYSVSGADGGANANKLIEILGLRTVFPLFMKTPKRAKRKGLSAAEHEEHVISIIAGLLRHTSGSNKSRVLVKFEENEFEKVERLGELHFKYLEKMDRVDREIKASEAATGEKLEEDEIYLQRMDGGLFTLQQIDYIIVEASVASSRVKDKVLKVISLHGGSMTTVGDIVREYSSNLGGDDNNDNEEWTSQQQEHIAKLLTDFES